MAHETPRKEIWFRLIFSLFGLGLMFFAILYRGVSNGIVAIELILIPTVLFGGTCVWAVRKLLRKPPENKT